MKWQTGEGVQEIQTTRYKITKLQGCNVQHKENSQYFIITVYAVCSIVYKNMKLLHCTSEINIIL